VTTAPAPAHPATDPVLASLGARRLAKRFEPGSVPVLAAIDLDAWPGTLTVVTGGPGSGKTTLLRCLAGTYRATAGSVVLRAAHTSVDLTTADARTLAWLRTRWVALLSGTVAASPRTTGAAAVARAATVDRERAQAGLVRVGAGALADVALGRLRPAQRHLVELAGVLAGPASILLLDEPRRPGVAEGAVEQWVHERRAAGAAVVVADSTAVGWEPDAVGVLSNGGIEWPRS